MRTRGVAAVLLALPLGGCAAYLPGAETFGSTAVNGRACRFYATDGQVEFAVLFDTRDNNLKITRMATQSRSGPGGRAEVEEDFRTADGHAFAVRHRPPDLVVIGGREYSLADGRVFLARLDRRGNECEQLPAAVPPRADGFPDERYVREELLRAAAGNPRLASFLGVGSP